MKIAMVASEAAPFVKTGGLGDVLQALPQALSEIKNNEVSVFLPFYDRIKYSGKYDVEFLGYFDVPLAWRREYVGLLRLKSRRKKLPDGTSAYTFCMCPGGYVVAAASEEGGVVTNGMSNCARDGQNANAALLVTLSPEDFPDKGTLGGVRYQQQLERAAFEAGGKNYHAPAQLVGDFLAHRPSTALGTVQPTYRPGVTLCDLHDVLPARITRVLENALPELDRKLHGFANPDAVMTAPETRSSSPVRILRGENRQSDIAGLYPCGEGAGYAGGIMSAAVDGILTAEAILEA